MGELEAARVELRAMQEQLGDMSMHQEEDLTARRSEMEELKVMIAKQAEQEKKNKQKTRAAMEKSLLAGDQGLLLAVTQCWRDLTKDLKLNKAKKEQSQAMAMRGIANSGTAMLDFCLTAWYKILQEQKVVKAQQEKQAKEDAQGSGAKGANKNVLAQLEKQFGEQSKGLLREVIHGWVEVRKMRMKREKAKSVAGRGIAGAGQALVSICFGGWFKLYDENKEKRKRKAASHAKGMRMIANGENALLDFCLTQWHELAKTAGNSKRAKQSANEKALRLIAGRGTTMQKQVLHEWYVRVVKAREQKKKMKAVERNLVSSGEQMVQMVFSQWKAWQEMEHKKKARKMRSMASAEKSLQGNLKVLQQQIFAAWQRQKDITKTERMKTALANCKGAVDEDALLQSREELAELERTKATLEAQLKAAIKNVEEAEAALVEQDQVLQQRETDLSKVRKEINDTVKKACAINDELGKVGQFLQTWAAPKRNKSPTRKREDSLKGSDNSLPKIDGNTSRPRSGNRNRPTGPAAGPTAAWGE